jgi:transcriptional regulator with XRE-family HTH domain
MSKEFLTRIIEASGKSIKEFAKAIGVYPGTINKWLSGENKISQKNQILIRSNFKKEISKIYK